MKTGKVKENVQHTPGPWKLSGPSFGCRLKGQDWTVSGRNLSIASVHNSNDPIAGDDLESKANARLIAAAPDLLAALQVLEREMSEDADTEAGAYRRKTWPNIVRAAIAKVERK